MKNCFVEKLWNEFETGFPNVEKQLGIPRKKFNHKDKEIACVLFKFAPRYQVLNCLGIAIVPVLATLLMP